MTVRLKYESLMVPLPSTDQLHMTRFYRDKDNLGSPVFILHSAFSDSSHFYADDGSGIACFLAQQGYDVYVGDLRGKGKSWPTINSKSDFGCHQHIVEDIPALIQRIVKKRGAMPQIWIGHGWGGVLLSAFYARYADKFCPVSKMIHFGVRRRAVSSSFSSALSSLVFNSVAPLIMRMVGYFPSKALRIGTCDQSKSFFQNFQQWSKNEQWVDEEDGFCYGDAIRETPWPASYYIASRADTFFGHPGDVRLFMKEIGNHDGRMLILSKKDGNLQDYDHVDMVAHPNANSDHFPMMLNWLEMP